VVADFSPSLFGLWQKFLSQDVFFGGVAERLCRRRRDFWPIFFSSTFFFDFGRKIYVSPPIYDYHAPPSLVPWRLPPLAPQAPILSVVGGRRVAPTPSEGHAPPFSGRAWRHWVLASDLRLGGPGDGACLSRATVRHLGSSPTAGSLFLVFFASMFFVFFFCFSSLSLLALVQILWDYLLIKCYI